MVDDEGLPERADSGADQVTQRLLAFADPDIRPPCTCNCGLCRGECGCEGCQWDFDDDAAFQPVFVCCSVCGEVIVIEYEDGTSYPQGTGKAKCCAMDWNRYHAAGKETA